jgi:hypothetical protein
LAKQNAVRLTLFSKKIKEKERYFLVNFFFSENIKNKIDYVENNF